jgi:hypothetical protein
MACMINFSRAGKEAARATCTDGQPTGKTFAEYLPNGGEGNQGT